MSRDVVEEIGGAVVASRNEVGGAGRKALALGSLHWG